MPSRARAAIIYRQTSRVNVVVDVAVSPQQRLTESGAMRKTRRKTSIVCNFDVYAL